MIIYIMEAATDCTFSYTETLSPELRIRSPPEYASIPPWSRLATTVVLRRRESSRDVNTVEIEDHAVGHIGIDELVNTVFDESHPLSAGGGGVCAWTQQRRGDAREDTPMQGSEVWFSRQRATDPPVRGGE